MSGAQRGFNFKRPFIWVPGSQRGFNFANEEATEVFPEGYEATLWGMASVTGDTSLVVSDASVGDTASYGVPHLSATVRATGWLAQASGTPSIRLSFRHIRPAGFDALRWGSYAGTVVWNFNKELRPAGFNAFRGFGEHWVSLGTRRITPGMGVQTQWGTAVLSGGVRWIDLGNRGIAPGTIGSAFVSFAERQVFPQWFIATRYGQALVDHDHPVDPAGWDSQVFGEHEVHSPRILLDIPGFNAGEFGWPLVQHWIQDIKPQGWRDGGPTEHERFGRPEVYNLTQYVFQLDEPTASDGGVFGAFTYIENRNKVLRPESRDLAGYGVPEIYNNARIVTTPPFQEFTLWGDALVADANRELRPEGWDSFTLGHWMTVHNDGRVLAPVGWLSEAMGRPDPVWSNLQTTKPAHWDSQEFGVQMVAFRIREVAPFPLPPPPPFGAATVEHLQRTITVGGIDAWRHGLATVEERFTIIAPRSVLPLVSQVGDGGRVWNVTPELRQMGATHTEFGVPHVRNQWEQYEFQGFDSVIFGRQIVKDRRHWAVPAGIAPPPISQLHRVANVLPDPPGPRTIGAQGFMAGLVSTQNQVRTNVVNAIGGLYTRWGVPQIVYMGVMPDSIEPPYDESGTQFGRPALNRSQRIGAPSIPPPSGAVPDVGPRYIWAPRGYPYSSGLWIERGHPIDFYVTGGQAVFGGARVTHRHRTVLTSGRSQTSVGNPSLSLNPQYLRVDGTRLQKFGYPQIRRELELVFYGFEMSGFGAHRVESIITGPRTVRPAAIQAPGLGAHRVEHFHREVQPVGFYTFQISPPRPPAWPRTSTWVSNAYPPFQFEGAEHTLWGDAWVSLGIRTLEPVGTVHTGMDFTPGDFALRMRVTRRDHVRPISDQDGEVFGTAWVEHGQRSIAPGTIRPGVVARPQVIGRGEIAPAGFDASLFGDVQRWEAGKIKPHGDDLAEYGRAVIARALGPIGFGGAVGIPGIGRPVSPAGWDASDLGDPVAVANWCSSRAMAVQGAEMAQFGETTVST